MSHFSPIPFKAPWLQNSKALIRVALAIAVVWSVPNLVFAQVDDPGLPPPPVPRKQPTADDPLPPRPFVFAEILKAFPLLPPPFPTDKIYFCSLQEQQDYRANKFDPVLNRALELRSQASNYYGKILILAQMIKNETTALQEKPNKSTEDLVRLAKLTGKLAAVSKESDDTGAFIRDVHTAMDWYWKHSNILDHAEIISCSCPSVEPIKGLAISQVDSRGMAHLPPSKEFFYVEGKRGDAGYYELGITVRPAIGGGCQPRNDGKNYVSFPLYGGAGMVNEYFTLREIKEKPPSIFFPEELMKKMKVTFDNGKTTETESYSQSIEVPEGAKGVVKLEMWFLNGGHDAEGKAKMDVLSWP